MGRSLPCPPYLGASYFFHIFIKYGSQVLYPEYVKYPTTKNEVETHMEEFKVADLHGAFGSMDDCHVIMEKHSHRLK